MTDHDKDICTVLRSTPMTPAAIGREFAPANIKDRAGWGRKWVSKMRLKDMIAENADQSGTVMVVGRIRSFISMFRTVTVQRSAGLNLAQEFYQQLGFGRRSYLAPHANRPTPPRPHFSRTLRLNRVIRH